MKIINFVLLIISIAITTGAQDRFTFEFETQCGSPLDESQSIESRSGKVVKIIDGDTIQIRDKMQRLWTVELAGVDSSRNQKLTTQLLTDRILNKSVSFRGNPANEKKRRIEAVVGGDNVEINRFLVENGYSDYRETDYGYAVSQYTLCSYSKLVDRAKLAKLGIWANK
jgi:endonuclease YncB( thermonuclease family)